MNKISDDYTTLIGQTPLYRLAALEKALRLGAALYAKLESANPTGSIKDRTAWAMIDQAERDGRLQPGATIIEPTSGNTGIALAALGAARGYPVILTMPENMSPERRQLLAAYGAELVLTPAAAGMAGAIARAQELLAAQPGAFLPDQFSNPANPRVHYQQTGPEIWLQTAGQLDGLVAGVGTGGTISGIGRYLKEQDPRIHVVAVEPADSAVLSGKPAGPHDLQGIGAGFIPQTLDTGVWDEIIPVSSAAAYEFCRQLVQTEGLLAGISSGAVLWAAAQLAAQPAHRSWRIVVILPDSGDRYLSNSVFSD